MQSSLENVSSLLSSKAVLFRLFTSSFDGKKKDKRITSEIRVAHGMSADLLNANKRIMQGKELNAVSASLQSLRKTSERLSAPWLDGGLRILPARRLVSAKVEIEAAIRDFTEKVEKFIDNYDVIISRDARPDHLNTAFNRADYPSKAELRNRFAARIEFFPIATDFRVEGISAAIKEDLESEMQKLTAGRIAEAKIDLIDRIRETVLTLASKLENLGDGSRFHAATIANVAAVCAEVKDANFDDDQKLSDLADRVTHTISALSSDSIRDSDAARSEAKETAARALAEISEAMAGFVC